MSQRLSAVEKYLKRAERARWHRHLKAKPGPGPVRIGEALAQTMNHVGEDLMSAREREIRETILFAIRFFGPLTQEDVLIFGNFLVLLREHHQRAGTIVRALAEITDELSRDL